MFSLDIQQLLDDLTWSLGPQRLILAYLNDIYGLGNDPKPWTTFRPLSPLTNLHPTQYGKRQDYHIPGRGGA
jgi:hypothetical protein